MGTTLQIDERFRGPPASGNGGYVAGLLAEALGGSELEVTLRAPPPLGQALALRREGEGGSLWNGDALVASAEPRSIALEPPPATSLEAAEEASRRFTGFDHHIFPGCFVCGPERAAGDGLRIFPGAIGPGRVAAPWIPAADLCDGDGMLLTRFLWAALDCPGYFAVQAQAGLAVLGRFAVTVRRRPSCGEPLVVMGWSLGSEGRKHEAGTALYAGDEAIAKAEATWISIPAQKPEAF